MENGLALVLEMEKNAFIYNAQSLRAKNFILIN